MDHLYFTNRNEFNPSNGISDRIINVFHRKNRRGSIVKIAREHYLRDDISCGIITCSHCVAKRPKATLTKVQVQNEEIISLFPFKHLLMFDTNLLLHKSDILMDDLFQNVILPQTVWEEVKHKSPPAYKKMYDAVFQRDCAWFVFMNEFCQDTYCERKRGETANDRNDRAIRRTALYYQEHLADTDMKVVLITDDKENKVKAEEEKINCCTLREYLENLNEEKSELLDKLASIEAQESGDGSNRGKLLFEEHKTFAEVQSGIKSGKYKQGSFQVSRDNYLEAFVYIDGEEEPIFIQGRMNCNRAIHDDTVAIEMLPKAEWSCPAKLLKVRDLEEKKTEAESELEADDEIDAAEDAEVKAATDAVSDLLPTARVIGIVRRNWRPYCGLLLQSAVPGARRHLFAAAERRIPRIRVETRQSEQLKGNRIIVCIDSWPRDSRYPLGHYVRSIGKLGDRETENEVLLLEHDVPHEKFNQLVLDCLPETPWMISEEDRNKREDLRHLNICSVDPPGCTDIDDALHCRNLDDGRIEVGVHIADVSHFVRPNIAMDKEASRRGTTVYLIDQRIDMLPELLSSNLCSLRGGEERFAFSVIWQLTHDAQVLDVRFCKSIICSRAALTYAEAQARIDSNKKDPVSVSLRRLNKLAKKMKTKRKANGALSLASMEIRFNIDSESHDPIEVQEKKVLETNSMVEEFMLLANISVAEKISSEYPDCALLRRHPVPAQSNYKPVLQAAKSRGFDLCPDSGKALADSLDGAVLRKNPFFNTMLRILTTRCMTQAVYFVSGTLDQKLYYHFGLATPIYTHFTSPIRRYADLMVHRLLAATIDADSIYPTMLDKRINQEICNNLNYRHKMAQYASRASVLLNTHLYFREKVEDLEGYILMIRRNALQVLIPKYGLESAVFIDKNSPFVFNEKEGCLVAEQYNIELKMFDKVTVQLSLDTTDQQHNKLRLKLVEPKVEGFSVEPIFGVSEPSTEEPEIKKQHIDVRDVRMV